MLKKICDSKFILTLTLLMVFLTGDRVISQTTEASPRAVMPEIMDLQKEISKLKDNQYDLQKTLLQGSALPAEELQKIRNLELELAELKKAKELSDAALVSTAKNEEAPTGPLDELLKSNESQTWAINTVWTLIMGFLVMFMQAGFAMVETGFTRAKNVAHTMSMNFMVYAIGMLGFWFSGFGIMFGGTGGAGSVSTVATLGPEVGATLNSLMGVQIGSSFWGFMGGTGFCLPPSMFIGSIFTLFLFQMVFMDTTATIPTGSMAERWRFLPFCFYAFIVGAFIYPLYGCWVWGGGWLAGLGKSLGLGNGHVDFAGSSVVHLCGGVLALVGAKVIGPRLGKYNKNGSSNPIPGHNIPMGIVGTFILAFGWFGFNSGSTLSGMDTQIGIIAVNTMLASAAGAVTGMIATWIRYGRPDPSFMCNGMLAGLVAITAPCAFVDSWAAVVIGAIAGVLVVFAAVIIDEKLKIDDPVGAISVHGVNGLWGVLSLGLLANNKYGAGWNGVESAVGGLFYGHPGQFVAQLIGSITCIIAVGAMGWVMFTLIEKWIGNRVLPQDELQGLDIPEMGVLGYQPDVNPESK
jgi:ammonium transporter, Amt family